jgi:UDP-N-acetylmuramate--alanine ligase
MTVLTPGTYHLIGIGGIGVSAVARLLHARGLKVQGSDVRESQITLQLRALGIPVMIGQVPANLGKADTVIVSTAIPSGNPELVAAKHDGLRLLHRSEALGALLEGVHGIGVIGTHGKGTVSAGIAWLLDQAGFQPGFVIGGLLENYRLNARPGVDGKHGEWLVAEVDESDGSLVNSRPEFAVLNNLELDHLNYYPEWSKLEAAVLQFFHDNPNLRVAVLNADDAGVRKILSKLQIHTGAKLLTFGFGPAADIRGSNVETRRMAASFDVEQRQEDGTYALLGRVQTALPGKYNASNILGAIATALAAGAHFADIQRAVPEYKGLENRFTLVDANGVEVVKDYISHPTGIARVLEAAKEQSNGPVIAVFKPYRFTMIHYLLEDYREAFRLADRVLVTELYTAGESQVAQTNVHTLCAKIKEAVADVTYVHAIDDIPAWLEREVTAPATVLFFGGDDLFQMADRYVKLRTSQA